MAEVAQPFRLRTRFAHIHGTIIHRLSMPKHPQPPHNRLRSDLYRSKMQVAAKNLLTTSQFELLRNYFDLQYVVMSNMRFY